jgi:flagellar protein FliL
MRRILLLIMASMLLASQTLAEDAAPKKLSPPAAVSYYEFPDHFTTNLRSSNRLIQATIAVDTQYDQALIDRVIKHRLAIANEILLLLSNLTEADVRSPSAKAKLQDDIRDAANAVLDGKYQFGGIDHAYITSIVIQ